MKTPFRDSYFYTTHADLAAVLSALNFKMRTQEPITRVVSSDGKSTTTFYFEDRAENEDFGTIDARDCVACFRGEPTERIKAECPALASHIDYMATAFRNRALMIEAIKTNVKALGAHQIGEKTMFLPLDASPELEAKMRKMIAEVG
jgi:hypothetical protein